MLKSVELRIDKHQIIHFCFPSSFDSAHENHQIHHGFDWRDYCFVYMSARYELFIHPNGRFFLRLKSELLVQPKKQKVQEYYDQKCISQEKEKKKPLLLSLVTLQYNRARV